MLVRMHCTCMRASLSLSLSLPLSLLQTPILFYSAHDPHKAFTKSIKPVREGEPLTEVPLILELQWVLSATAVNRPQLLDMLHTAVGIDQIVYLYAKVCACTYVPMYVYKSAVGLSVSTVGHCMQKLFCYMYFNFSFSHTHTHTHISICLFLSPFRLLVKVVRRMSSVMFSLCFTRSHLTASWPPWNLNRLEG